MSSLDQGWEIDCDSVGCPCGLEHEEEGAWGTIEGYEEQNELGLYIVDTKTKDYKVIPDKIGLDQIPRQWIETQ